MTKEEFLQSTLDYYGANPIARRNIAVGGTCKYQPLKETSEGCAIGRFMPKDKSYRDYCDSYGSITEILNIEWLVERLPEWMRKMDLQFLSDIQKLHDSPLYEYWNAKGLTKDGKEYVNYIIVEYELNMSRISLVD